MVAGFKRALFIGLGGAGQRHLRILKELQPDIQVAAVRKRGRTFEIRDDMRPDNSVNLEDKYKIQRFKHISDSMVFQPDFAIVANPTSLHVETVIELVENRIPVLVEKPISNSNDGLDKLLFLSKGNETPVMVGYMMRFNPCVKLLKRYLDKIALGRIYNIIVNINSYMPAWHGYESYNEFYAGRKDLGGGVVLTEIHEIDLLYWFFGRHSKLAAIGGNISNFKIDVEDTVSVIMEQNDNTNCFPVSVNMSFVQKTPVRNFLILGEFGRLEWDIINNRLQFDDYEHDLHETHQFPEFDRKDMFRDQMNHFLDCLKNSTSPLTELGKVLGGQYTALAVKEALAKQHFAVL